MKPMLILGELSVLALSMVAVAPASAHDACDCGYGRSYRRGYGSRVYGSRVYGSRNYGGDYYRSDYYRSGYYRSDYSRSGYSRGDYYDGPYDSRRDADHARHHYLLERDHARGHRRGFDSRRDHDRFHKELGDHHDADHHRIYDRHAPERYYGYR